MKRFALVLASCGFLLAAYAQPILLKPATPQPDGPRLQSIKPSEADPADFVARTADYLELARRFPATEQSSRHEIAGIDISPASPTTAHALRVLADEAAPYDPTLRERSLGCKTPSNLPADYQLVILDVSRIGRAIMVPVFLTPEANELVYLEVALHRPGLPVMLLVTGYTGVALRLAVSHQTQLAAVHLQTYYPNAVLGVDPAKVSQTYHGQGNQHGCRYAEKADATVAGLHARPASVETYRPDRGPQLAIGGVVRIERQAPRLGAFLDPEMPAPHQFGLAVLAHKKYLRPVRLKAEGTRSPVHGGLMVLKPFRIPEGLYGGHSTTFLVPAGTRPPSGALGHSDMYLMPR